MPFELVIPIGQATRKSLLTFQREIIRRNHQLEHNNLINDILEQEARSFTTDGNLSTEFIAIIKTVIDGLDNAVGTDRYQSIATDLANRFRKLPPFNPIATSATEQEPMLNLHINLGIRIGDISLAMQNKIKDTIRNLIVDHLNFANDPIKLARSKNLYLSQDKQTGSKMLEASFDPTSELRLLKLRSKIIFALQKIAASDTTFTFTSMLHADNWIPTVILFQAVNTKTLYSVTGKAIILPVSEFKITHLEGITKHVKEMKHTRKLQIEYESLFIAPLSNNLTLRTDNQHSIFAPKKDLIGELFGSTEAAQRINALDF